MNRFNRPYQVLSCVRTRFVQVAPITFNDGFSARFQKREEKILLQ